MGKEKVIIAGGRDINIHVVDIRDALEREGIYIDNIDCIISGACKGADRCGEYFAEYSHLPVKVFKADWCTHGKAAGPIRNREMAEFGDCLLLIWNGYSKGSLSMKKEMLKLNKPVYEVIMETFAEQIVFNREKKK